jgi:hypothetical protein
MEKKIEKGFRKLGEILGKLGKRGKRNLWWDLIRVLSTHGADETGRLAGP